MKKTIILALALCLLGAASLPALSEALVSEAVEAPVPEAWTAGGDNGLTVEGGEAWDDPIAWSEGEALVRAAEADAAEEEALDLPAPEDVATDGGLETSRQATVRALPAIEDDRDPDALFAGYAKRILYGNGKTPLLATVNAGRELTGMERAIYDRLKEAVLQIADGSRASAVVDIPLSELLGKTEFSAAELGVALRYDAYGRLTRDSYARMFAAFEALAAWDIDLVLDALWFDCAYELYWFDRYENGGEYWGTSYGIDFDPEQNDYVLYTYGDIICKLPVLAQYAADDIYTVDTALLSKAKQAAASAKAIVDLYADCSDYAKLYGYAYEICRLNTYNDLAAQDGWNLSEQNPWKLIWVFDGDPDTNVVCEGCTLAFQYLCELSGFDSGVRCFAVSGDASVSGDPGGAHAWNVVRMGDGRNYLLDVTWMDGWDESATGSMADWIAGGQAGALFLAGGSGSVSGGYTVDMGYDTTFRVYDDSTRKAYPESVLALSPTRYVPQGLMRIGGMTYCFDDGAYVTGMVTLDGVTYNFDRNGVLTDTWTPGWHTIGGRDYFFDENGLHTEHIAQAVPAVPATCEEDGLTEGKRCAVCGATLVEQDVAPALGHWWSKPAYTLSDDGSAMTARRVCGRDESHVDTETVETTASVALAPTCTEMGVTAYTAVFNSKVFTRQTRTLQDIPATGHTPVIDAAVDATYTDTGLTEGSHCAVCNAILVAQQVVPRLPRVDLSAATVSAPAQACTGKALEPAVTVTLDGAALVEGADYEVAYASNREIGTAAVTVTGVGKYEGAATGTFRINPKKVSGVKLKAGAKRLAVSWKKVGGVTGYQVQYAANTTFKGAKTVTVKGAKTLKATLKKLKARTAYCVRVRAYKTVKGVRYTSAWSAVKSKRTE